MSRDEPGICSSPVEMLPPVGAIPVPSSSRASSSSSLRFIGIANGSSDRLAEAPPPLTSSSQSSLPRSASDVMPQTEGSVNGSGTSTPEIDVQILEALKSKDRLFVLKVGEQMEALIREKNSRSRISLSPENQYQRLLVHRCAAYYKLTFENEPAPRDKSGIRDMTVLITIESRIPSRRISELVPAEQAQHPTFKIMRRTDLDRRRQKSSISRPGSTADEDGELSDPGPSESGSMGSRSTTSKKRMTIAEREAAYAQARSRIFMGFEEKAKERDSASSSTLSLVSASGSGSHSGGAGGSSVSDIDDNASTAPTESEWSVSGTDRRRGGDSGMSSADSTRSFPSYAVQNSGNDRASGTASPAFTYPSLYDSSAHVQGYEHGGYIPHPGGYMAPYPMYAYPHPPPNAGPIPPGSQPYMAPYQYFPQYPYANPSHQPPHSSSDPASPVTGPVEAYPHHAATVPFMSPNGYGWIPPAAQQHNSSSEHHPSSNPGANHAQTPPAQVQHVAYPYPHYMGPPGAVPYASYPPYFQPPPQTHHSLIHPHSQPRYPIELPSTNGNASDRGTSSGLSSGNGSPSPTLSRHTNSSGSSNGNHNPMGNNGGIKRGASATRGAWSYGPGIGMHGNGSGSGAQNGPGGETVGPRLSSSMRRPSGASSSSGGYKTPGDETASVASSSASSSSSRRTYMSTPSMHPLPARPDWAAGLKAQPTLHPPVRHRNDSNGSRTMSPARPPGQALHSHQHQQPAAQQRPPIVLQPTDFPPLSSLSSPSDKRPAAGSVWANRNTAARTIVSPNPGSTNHSQGNTYGTALFNHSNGNRLEDDERGFERPPPKDRAELFNPKGGAKRTAQADVRQNTPDGTGPKIETERTRGEIVANAILVDKMEALKIQTQPDEIDFENTPKADSLLSGLPYVPKIVGDNAGEGLSGSVADEGVSST